MRSVIREQTETLVMIHMLAIYREDGILIGHAQGHGDSIVKMVSSLATPMDMEMVYL